MKAKDDEFEYIQQLLKKSPKQVQHKVLNEVQYKGESYPIHSFVIGDPEVENIPTLGLFGGVHGLEKVGSQVVLSYLNYLFEQLSWNQELQDLFKKIRLVSIPIVNPVGLYHNLRANGNGVDLMRNAPVESEEEVPFLVGGQKYSSLIPWYRGRPDTMEIESKELCEFVKKYMIPCEVSMSIDFHSGFGLKDRLWYPYASTKKTFDEIQRVKKLENLLEHTIPHHIYKIEPQSVQYLTHGDLWDYLYGLKKEINPNSCFIPWTLEMGSWIWFKKNPMQIFSPHGLFNPMKSHRFNRVMRRHFLMLDFFLKAVANPKEWTK